MVWPLPRPWSQSPSEHCKPYARRVFCVWSTLFWIWSRRPRAQGALFAEHFGGLKIARFCGESNFGALCSEWTVFFWEATHLPEVLRLFWVQNAKELRRTPPESLQEDLRNSDSVSLFLHLAAQFEIPPFGAAPGAMWRKTSLEWGKIHCFLRVIAFLQHAPKKLQRNRANRRQTK